MKYSGMWDSKKQIAWIFQPIRIQLQCTSIQGFQPWQHVYLHLLIWLTILFKTTYILLNFENMVQLIRWGLLKFPTGAAWQDLKLNSWCSDRSLNALTTKLLFSIILQWRGTAREQLLVKALKLYPCPICYVQILLFSNAYV